MSQTKSNRSRRAASQRPANSITVQRLSKAILVETPRIIRAVHTALGEHAPANIHIVLVNDGVMAALHDRYLNDPTPTDVLTFDLRDDPDEPGIEGEIVISLETAKRQARQFSTKPADEVLRYCIHGVLHLNGYDDHSAVDRRRMRREENRVLAIVKSSRGEGRRV